MKTTLKNQTRLQQDDDMPPIVINNFGNKSPCAITPIARRYEFYLTGEILDPEYYVDWFTIIRSANENDQVIIYINSAGGSADTAIQFLSVLEDCEATIMMQVEGSCMSAASMIFMKADVFSIAKHSQFMLHNYRGGAVGKGGELEAQVNHQTKWANTMLRDIYKHFLTEAELQSILDGKDLWMDGEEVLLRMAKRNELFKKEFETKEKEALKKEKEDKETKSVKTRTKK